MNELEFNRIQAERLSSLSCGKGSLTYNKTYEEETKEQEQVSLAENYLRSIGIEVKTNYGYYRNTYDILKDLGEYWSKLNA